MAASIWERFTHDPRHQEHVRLRASDSDRDIVNDVLATAYAEGRLTPEELDERSDQVAGAKTLGELPPVIDDLVARTSSSPVVHDKRAEAELRYRRQRQEALFSFITPTLICWVVWIFTSGPDGFPWPLFVMLATGLNYLRVASAVRTPSPRSSVTWRRRSAGGSSPISGRRCATETLSPTTLG